MNTAIHTTVLMLNLLIENPPTPPKRTRKNASDEFGWPMIDVS